MSFFLPKCVVLHCAYAYGYARLVGLLLPSLVGGSIDVSLMTCVFLCECVTSGDLGCVLVRVCV